MLEILQGKSWFNNALCLTHPVKPKFSKCLNLKLKRGKNGNLKRRPAVGPFFSLPCVPLSGNKLLFMFLHAFMFFMLSHVLLARSHAQGKQRI